MTYHPAPVEVWRELALCAQTGGDMFFPEMGENVPAAKRLCGDCPVRNRCLQAALDNNEQHGIWGGTTPRERRQLRKRAA